MPYRLLVLGEDAAKNLETCSLSAQFELLHVTELEEVLKLLREGIDAVVVSSNLTEAVPMLRAASSIPVMTLEGCTNRDELISQLVKVIEDRKAQSVTANLASLRQSVVELHDSVTKPRPTQ